MRRWAKSFLHHSSVCKKWLRSTITKVTPMPPSKWVVVMANIIISTVRHDAGGSRGRGDGGQAGHPLVVGGGGQGGHPLGNGTLRICLLHVAFANL